MVKYIAMKENDGLNNAYVRDYYNAQVGALSSYTDDRWHSTPVRAFEYQQTVRALKKALEGRVFKSAVEVGPGDAVFTLLIKTHVTGHLHLVEQSSEMLARAKLKVGAVPDISFEEGDFAKSHPPKGNELLIAIRCFEYFENKSEALKKMRTLLNEGARLVIVTKNPEMITSRPAQGKKLHSDQVSRSEMKRLSAEAGFTLEHTYPAVLRMKATLAPLRVIFDLLHQLSVALRAELPFTTYATESYVYELRAS